jgi:UDP-glucose 4-epimerase
VGVSGAPPGPYPGPMKLGGARILITGGAGFVGSHFVRDLLAAGASVTVYDNFSTGSEENLEGVEGDLKIVRGDILDYDALLEVARGHDAISHQAAQLEITRCIDNPVFDLTTNTIGSLNVFRAAAELGIEKVVEASSAGVYGQAVTDLQDETHPTNPNWEYGVSKLACEKYTAISCERRPELSAASLRYAIVYGEREWYGRVLTLFLKRALEGQSPVVFGRGHLILNGSTAVATSVLDLANAICDVVGERLEPIYDDVAEGAVSELAGGRMRLPSELQAMRMSYARAKDTLGWEPQVSLRDGLAREWKWLQENPHRWNEMSY